MKILHITASYKPAYAYGGPIMSVAKLCEETFANQEVRGKNQDSRIEIRDVTVYTTLANGKEELPYKNGEIRMVDGVKVHYFKRITKDHSHLSPALLWQLWKTVKTFDVVHIHAWWNLVTMPACLIAILRGKKVILTPRGTLSNYSFEINNSRAKALFHKYIGKSLLNKTYFHCTSQKEVEDTKKRLSPKAIFNLPNFVELPWHKNFDTVKISQTGELNLLFLSRIEKKKGLELLFKVLAKCNLSLNLAIVGNGEAGYIEELKQLSEQLKISENINWLGAIYGEQKFDLLAKYDYCVLPSYDENFANVVIESIFSGTPVLITENVGLSDYVLQKNLGLVCKRSYESIANMLIEGLEKKNQTYFQSEVLQNIVKADFREDFLRSAYLEMYNEVSEA